MEATDLDTQFSDGVYLCLLSGLLEGYFVPLYDFHLTPQVTKLKLKMYQILLFLCFQSFDEKVANVSLAFELMMDGGLPQPKARPEDIVNLDLKSTLRVLYNLFTKYKHLS